jgi:hypothetical protein
LESRLIPPFLLGFFLEPWSGDARNEELDARNWMVKIALDLEKY